jgi:hypothetical protein
MQTIKNGRKRGCGSCGQSESYESMLLDKPVIIGANYSEFRDAVSIYYTTGRGFRQVRPVAQLLVD